MKNGSILKKPWTLQLNYQVICAQPWSSALDLNAKRPFVPWPVGLYCVLKQKKHP